ncbi:MAG: hypothetical protein EP329_15915 [Deltaproteobacteria bacterium]|nr:MAG: hypothetical protein EP329_15915 [Deltaproteobacteria bacterium]
MTRIATLALLAGALVGCDQIQDMMNGGGSSSGGSDDGSASSSGGGSTTSGGGTLSVGSTDDDGPRGPISIGARTTPAPKQLIAPGTSTALPPPPIAVDASQCKDLSEGGELKVNDYITDTIKCGQTVIGHTRGGVNKFNTKFWEKQTCWPATVQHDGGDERVYKFVAETKGRVYFTLDSPCADLDLMAMHWSGSSAPTIDSDVPDCEAKIKDGTKREAVDVPAMEGWEYLVVVEGKGEEEGVFALTAQCGPWR